MKDFEEMNAPVISTTNWLITILITTIPLVNIIMLIVWAFSDSTNPNKSNWAKATLIWMLIGIVLTIMFWVIFGFAFMSGIENMEG